MYYIGNFVYENSSLKYILHDEGRIVVNGGSATYEYHLKDLPIPIGMGNTRVSFQAGGSTPMVLQNQDYYPFGMAMNLIQNDNRYLYNGKELQDDMVNNDNLDWYDYGARMYDPALGRWHVVDNSAEKGFSMSPYNYAFNNPIKYLDPDGNWPWESKSVRQARRFARATGGNFHKHSRSYRKETGTAATVFLHNTSAGLNVRQKYASSTGRGYGHKLSVDESDYAQTIEFQSGQDYEHYFEKPNIILIGYGAAAALALEEVIVVFPQLASLISSNESVDTDSVAADKTKKMAKTKLGKSGEVSGAEHTKGKSKSKKKKHEEGQTRKQQKNRDKKRQNKKWKSNR